MDTQAEDQQAAEQKIFDLLKEIDKHAAAGNTDEIFPLQLKISELQRKHGYVQGVGKDENHARTA